MTKLNRVATVLLAMLASPSFGQINKVDPRLPKFAGLMSAAIEGELTSIGSDTMNNLMQMWFAGLKRHQPKLKTTIIGKGSSTAPAALISGRANVGPMSRQMKEGELDSFKKKYGYAPTKLDVAWDMLGVFVHKDNPIAEKGLTLAQLDAIYSSTRKRGHMVDIKTWGDVGLDGEWKEKPIVPYGRNSASGTYGYFKKTVLEYGDFKRSIKEQPSGPVVAAVGRDRFGIGYTGIGYQTTDVVAVPVAIEVMRKPIRPEAANASKYPLARPMLIYVNREPGAALTPELQELVRYIYSQEGQTVVVKDGYVPVDGTAAKREGAKVGVEVKLKMR